MQDRELERILVIGKNLFDNLAVPSIVAENMAHGSKTRNSELGWYTFGYILSIGLDATALSGLGYCVSRLL